MGMFSACQVTGTPKLIESYFHRKITHFPPIHQKNLLVRALT